MAVTLGQMRTPNAPALNDGVDAAPNVLVVEPNACARLKAPPVRYQKVAGGAPQRRLGTCGMCHWHSAARTGVVLPNIPVLGVAPNGAEACAAQTPVRDQ